MSTNRVIFSRFTKLILVNVIFIILSMVMISECAGIVARAEDVVEDSETAVVVSDDEQQVSESVQTEILTPEQEVPVVERPENVTGFKLVKNSVNAVTLKWNNVENAEGYIIYRYNNTKNKWNRFFKSTSNINSHTITDLTAGVIHKFAIKAYVTTAEGKELSSAKYPTVSTFTYLPKVSGFKAGSVTTNSVKLSWTKVDTVKGYIVYKYDDAQKKWKRVAKTGNVNSYTVSGLSQNTKYSFAVKAYRVSTGKEIVSVSYPTISATTKKATLVKPAMIAESKYESSETHPYNKQINTLVVRWKNVKNAKSYQLYIKGGKYKDWTSYKTLSANRCTVSGLARGQSYSVKVRAINGTEKGPFSSVQNLKTAKMNFDAAGWEAMCRIVYHEVGQMNDDMWDRPIVYVADCVVNRYVAAKYSGYNNWSAAYQNYKNIQSIIYYSGGFMSSEGLARDGAVYSRVPSKVKAAVYGAVYGIAAYKNIQNDNSVYFWSNTAYYQNSSKIAYQFRIPWGYFNVWRSYWG